MIQVKRIDHVAIAVADASESSRTLAGLFGLAAGVLEHVPDQKTDVLFLQPAGTETALEVICPSGNLGLDKFLAKRGPGLHHICFEVANLTDALASLRADGIALIDETPRRGARGHLVAFIHPHATGGVLYELCQKFEGVHP